MDWVLTQDADKLGLIPTLPPHWCLDCTEGVRGVFFILAAEAVPLYLNIFGSANELESFPSLVVGYLPRQWGILVQILVLPVKGSWSRIPCLPGDFFVQIPLLSLEDACPGDGEGV